MTERVSSAQVDDYRILSYLLVLELDQVCVVLDDLVALVLATLEQLWERKPLTGHLVAVIGIDKLVIVNTVCGVPLHPSDSRLAAVEGNDVVDKSLSRWAKLKRLGWIWSVILRGGTLPDLVLLSRYA